MTRDTSMRSRKYSFADHGGSELGGRPGNFVLKPGTADYYSPSYADNAVTTIRMFPGKAEDGSLEPYRYSHEPGQFGDFIRYLCRGWLMSDSFGGLEVVDLELCKGVANRIQCFFGWYNFLVESPISLECRDECGSKHAQNNTGKCAQNEA